MHHMTKALCIITCQQRRFSVSKREPSQESTTGHEAEISGSWETQANLYIYNRTPVSMAQETSQHRG